MRTGPGILVLLLAAVFAASCGSLPLRERGQRNLITEDEIARVQGGSAHDVIRLLRPQFLQRRGPSSIANPQADLPVVYLDGALYGGINQLQAIPSNVIASIEYIDARDATTRWGTGHMGGVIAVWTKR
jgi:hypothetical protein